MLLRPTCALDMMNIGSGGVMTNKLGTRPRFEHLLFKLVFNTRCFQCLGFGQLLLSPMPILVLILPEVGGWKPSTDQPVGEKEEGRERATEDMSGCRLLGGLVGWRMSPITNCQSTPTSRHIRFTAWPLCRKQRHKPLPHSILIEPATEETVVEVLGQICSKISLGDSATNVKSLRKIGATSCLVFTAVKLWY